MDTIHVKVKVEQGNPLVVKKSVFTNTLFGVALTLGVSRYKKYVLLLQKRNILSFTVLSWLNYRVSFLAQQTANFAAYSRRIQVKFARPLTKYYGFYCYSWDLAIKGQFFVRDNLNSPLPKLQTRSSGNRRIVINTLYRQRTLQTFPSKG